MGKPLRGHRERYRNIEEIHRQTEISNPDPKVKIIPGLFQKVYLAQCDRSKLSERKNGRRVRNVLEGTQVISNKDWT